MAASVLARSILSWVILSFFKRTDSMTKGVTVLQEVCMGESFEAQCPDGQVVLVLSALYGRMHVGRCARQDDIGCAADVMRYIDTICSGKRQCDLLTPDPALYALNTCPLESTPYLETVYSCIPVISDPAIISQCQHSGVIVLAGIANGTIASSIVQISRQGTSVCPWVIDAEQGQRINITLVDFRSPDIDSSGATCHIYATVIEHNSPSPTTLCSGAEREQVVYLSSSSHLEIQFVDTQAAETTSSFLLRFLVLGCGDPNLNGNVIKRITAQQATLYCKSTGIEQHIFCEGTSWNQPVDPCQESHWSLFSYDSGSNKGIWIVLTIGIAIGVAIGVGVLFCGVMCFKRYKKETNRQSRESPYYQHSGAGTNQSFTTLKNVQPPSGEMDYATYDRAAAGAKHYMRVTSPFNRDVMVVETGSIRRHGSIPPMDYERSPIRYADQEESAYEKPSS